MPLDEPHRYNPDDPTHWYAQWQRAKAERRRERELEIIEKRKRAGEEDSSDGF